MFLFGFRVCGLGAEFALRSTLVRPRGGELGLSVTPIVGIWRSQRLSRYVFFIPLHFLQGSVLAVIIYGLRLLLAQPADVACG